MRLNIHIYVEARLKDEIEYTYVEAIMFMSIVHAQFARGVC